MSVKSIANRAETLAIALFGVFCENHQISQTESSNVTKIWECSWKKLVLFGYNKENGLIIPLDG